MRHPHVVEQHVLDVAEAAVDRCVLGAQFAGWGQCAQRIAKLRAGLLGIALRLERESDVRPELHGAGRGMEFEAHECEYSG